MKISRHFLKLTISPESARSASISKIRRTRGIQPSREDSPVSARLIDSDGFRPRLLQDRATVPHSPPQLGDLSLEAHPSSRVSSDLFGFVGCYSRGPRALFCDCSLVVLCPPVDLLVYGHRPFSLGHRPFSLAHGLFYRFTPAGSFLRLRALFTFLRALCPVVD